ncbi:interleukin-6 receptor subunit beta-like isoform X1 [Carcharodon carcharias]|uniref:interleukin-6 receptor subunit beta-like isoform X1 n=1 Tax=Carcharodon carcharias TaxID=13397 RepID=UPI001B7EE18E|nr:interleukin-6 receptor subunit beta-like isoform X1 [Carcharodon carcharias]XP_041054895.1 interleukin-6 receptor subunit beta-like isoform X1 [Carcharodon carcharias]
MFSIEKSISAWAWVSFSLCACIIEGELSLLCHDVDSTPKVVKLQSNVSLSCALREDCLESLDANASHIFWKINDTQISRKQYHFNATVSRVTFLAVKGYLTCHVNMKGVTNILHRFTIEAGLPPDKPKNISCISYWQKNFTCFWDQGHETYIETHFTVIRKQDELVKDTCFTSNRMCSFMFPHLYIVGNFKMIVTAQNALGKAESDPLLLDTWHTWKTDPPQNVTVHSIRGQLGSLLVTWHEATVKPPRLVLFYGLQYQMVGTGKWIQGTEEKIKNTSFVIKNLKFHTNYTVAVRCIGEDQPYWSDWSSKKTGLTSEAKPSKRPTLWRQVKQLDSQGNRKVHLLWKALNRFEANGIILGYRLWYEKRRDPTVMQPCNSTSLNYSFILTHEAYVVTVVAYNSAGVSPKATLIVPAINQTDLTTVQYVKITPQNNQLLVQWKTSRPPDNGYVIEWCLILDTNPCAGPLHWQHEDNTSEMTYLQGDLERFKRYNISVYAMYNDGPGNPFSVPAYLQQDIPAEGPDIVAPIVKGTEATIKWHEIPVEKQRGFITNYTIFYKSAKGENAVTVNSTVHEYTLKSLQKNTEYTLYIMASTEKGGRNVSTYFTTDELEQEDTVVIVVPVLVCFLLIVNFLIICFRNKHRIKKRIWPDVADPAGSTLADWFHECQYKNGQTPKLLNPGSDFNTDFSTVEVLSLSEESMLQPVRKEKTSQLHTAELEFSLTVSPPQQSTSNGEKDNLLQSMNTVMYTVLEQGYKSQIPDISRSLSKQPLLSITSQKCTSDFETEINAVEGAEENWCPQNTDENDVFQPIAKTNPYLKNSLNVTESQIAPGLDSSSDPVFDNCCNVDKKLQGDTETLDLNLQSSQQDNQLTNPVQTYITVELLGFMLNNEM